LNKLWNISGGRAIGNAIDDNLRSKDALALPLHGIASLTLVGIGGCKSVFPASVVKQGDIVGEQEKVGVLYRVKNVRDSGGAGLAALRLEELNEGEGLKVNKASSCVLMAGVLANGMAMVVESDGTDHGGLLLPTEELGKERGHCLRWICVRTRRDAEKGLLC